VDVLLPDVFMWLEYQVAARAVLATDVWLKLYLADTTRVFENRDLDKCTAWLI
jgi:hypothetical protein